MAKEYINLLLPVGRMVYGYVDKPRARTDSKTGAPKLGKDGAQMMEYSAGVAIKKGGETHWNQTPWGRVIWDAAVKQWPQGQYQMDTFAFKITDGDSQKLNKKMRRPCDNEGYPGHWVINSSNGSAPQLTDRLGKVNLTDRSVVVPGRYVQAYISITSNESSDSPGMYLNLQVLAYSAWGEDIVSGFSVDPSTVGFGADPLPEGAQEVPTGQVAGTGAPLAGSASTTTAPPPAPPAGTVGVSPNTGFANPGAAASPPAPPAPPSPPPAPPVPQKRMTSTAAATYEAYIAAGWNDDQLINAGHMVIA